MLKETRAPNGSARCRLRVSKASAARRECPKPASSPTSSSDARPVDVCGPGVGLKIPLFVAARKLKGLDGRENRAGGRWHHAGRGRGTARARGRDGLEP